MFRGYRDSPLHGDEQLRWDHHAVSHINPRHGVPLEYRSFEERHAIRPFGMTRIPSELYPTTRIIIIGNNTGHGGRRALPQSSHPLVPSLINQETTQASTETDGSKLTKEEQDIVLKKLKKEIYNPMPKILARRVNLYYRDLNKDPNAKGKEKHRDEDGKSCAVCLEDFEPREEVMLTPCNHMFHEECVVPWVKNHGKCPVCRTSFYEMRENNGSALNSTRPVDQPVNQRVQFADEFLSLIQAVDEAFPWRF